MSRGLIRRLSPRPSHFFRGRSGGIVDGDVSGVAVVDGGDYLCL